MDRFSPASVAGFINRQKCDFKNPSEREGQSFSYYEKQLFEIYTAYEAYLKQNQGMDFGDLLTKPLDLFKTRPHILAHYTQRLRYIFVDEYQDTNHVQYELLKMLAGPHQEFCVVGDEDQSIYRFRGADIDNILNFQKDFPSAKVIRLEQNYRSTQTILYAANEVVRHNTKRLGKNLWSDRGKGEPVTVFRAKDDREEAAYVIGEVMRLGTEPSLADVPLDQIAIFYRTNAQSRVFEEECRRYNIPYRIYGGLKFFERKEIKDIVAYLRLLVNPHDSVSFKRIVNIPARGIGKTTLDRVQLAAIEKGLSMVDVIANHAGEVLNARARPLLTAFFGMVSKLKSKLDQIPLTDLVTLLLKETGYEQMLKDDPTREAGARLENIDEFLNAVAEYERRTDQGTLSQFLEQISLEASYTNDDKVRSPLQFMTLHLAKGLEFPYVFIVGLEENLLPHVRSLEAVDDLEEERRLLYVGMTRAMTRLTVSYAYKRYAHGREHWNIPSRFLEELPKDAIVAKGIGRPPLSSQSNDNTDYSQVSEWEDIESNGYRVGNTVRHPEFGKGIIRQLEGDSENPKLTILFENGQMKKILGKYAQLEPLED